MGTPVAAYHCKESVNPHGENIPPGGWSTEPGNNPNSPCNPDGFCTLDGPVPTAGHVVEIFYGYEGNEELWGPFDYGTVVKFTQAPGSEPKMKKIGSTNGQAGAVNCHFIVPGEPYYTVYYDGVKLSWGYCYEPPPPF